MNLILEIDDLADIIHTNLAATVARDIHLGTPDLRDTMLGRIIDRTPYRKGALQADETGDAFTDPSTNDLVHLYTRTENQLEEWHRVYAAYVEGPELGLKTYTNPPRQMFASAETEDISVIEDWGVQQLEKAIDNIVGGGGEKR
jgi:hypothetical protein